MLLLSGLPFPSSLAEMQPQPLGKALAGHRISAVLVCCCAPSLGLCEPGDGQNQTMPMGRCRAGPFIPAITTSVTSLARQHFPLHSEIKANPRGCSIPAEPFCDLTGVPKGAPPILSPDPVPLTPSASSGDGPSRRNPGSRAGWFRPQPGQPHLAPQAEEPSPQGAVPCSCTK